MTQLEQLLTSLKAGNVEFIIVGGVAARAHGSSRLTDDLDIVYRRSQKNLIHLQAALAPFDPYLRGAPRGLPFDWSAETLKAGLNFTLTTTIGAIDLLGEISGVGRYESLLPHALSITVFGIQAKLLDIETLIRAKRAAGRPKDFEVIAELEVILDASKSAGN